MTFTFLDSWQLLIPTKSWLWLFVLASLITLIISYGAYRNIVQLGAKPKRYFVYITSINVGVMLLLFALALPINKIGSQVQQTVLITPGVTQQQIESLNFNNIKEVYLLIDDNEINDSAFKAVDLKSLPKGVITIKAIEQLPIDQQQMANLSIYGNGLTHQQLNLLENSSIDFYPSPKFLGLIEGSWQKELVLGQPFIVEGAYQQGEQNEPSTLAKHNIVEIALFDPFDKKVASERVKADEKFTLQTQIKTQGNFVYTLKVINNLEQVISQEHVAVSVKKDPLVKLLIRQSSPSFETRQLKNLLTEQGAMVVVQTQISKEKTISQKLNVRDNKSVINANNFDLALLAQFDLLVIDGRGLLGLSEHEVSVLIAAIEKGLGLYVMVDSSLIAALSKNLSAESSNDIGSKAINTLLKGFSLSGADLKTHKEVQQLFWVNGSTMSPLKIMLATLNVEQGEVLVKGNQQQVIVATKQKVMGNIALSLFNQSYSLTRQEQALVYSQLWQYLIAKISRNNQQSYWLPQTKNTLNRTNVQSLQCAIATQSSVNVGQGVSSPQLYLSANIAEKHKVCGYIWPEQKGWMALELNDAKNQLLDHRWLYSYSYQDWATWQQSLTHKATKKAMSYAVAKSAINTSTPINKTVLWLLLFMGCTLLWLDHKSRR